ncbi:unnamed protein product [Brassica rapa subsp. narinosa]
MNQLFHFSSFFRFFLRLLAAKKRFSRRWKKSSYGSTLFTSVTTNSSRRNKELLEKETIPMETESTRTGTQTASGKANDVNNAKKIKAYMDKVYTGIISHPLCFRDHQPSSLAR